MRIRNHKGISVINASTFLFMVLKYPGSVGCKVRVMDVDVLIPLQIRLFGSFYMHTDLAIFSQDYVVSCCSEPGVQELKLFIHHHRDPVNLDFQTRKIQNKLLFSSLFLDLI